MIVPATRTWVLKEFLPTGETRPVDDRLDFRSGQPIRGLKLDDVLTGLEYEGTRGVCRLVDEEKGAEFRLGFDRTFRELVLYTPPGRPQVISLEPYTQTTDAIHLQARGVDAGLRVLGHGAQEQWNSRWNPWDDRRRQAPGSGPICTITTMAPRPCSDYEFMNEGYQTPRDVARHSGYGSRL